MCAGEESARRACSGDAGHRPGGAVIRHCCEFRGRSQHCDGCSKGSECGTRRGELRHTTSVFAGRRPAAVASPAVTCRHCDTLSADVPATASVARESSSRRRQDVGKLGAPGTKVRCVRYCLIAVVLLAAAATVPGAGAQDERGRVGEEHVELPDHGDGEHALDEHELVESLDVRQGVDDWTPSQVAHWLHKEGITPWHAPQYLTALEEHDIDGHLLLSLHPPDILHVLDADMEQQRPADFKRNLEMLRGKLGELREAIAQNPVDFWEYQVAHRRTAALIFCGLALAPRVTIFYMLLYARQPLFLVVGPHGLSMLSLVLMIFAPNLAVSLHLRHVVKHAPVLLVVMIASHAAIFLGALASTRGSTFGTVVWEAIKCDVTRIFALLLAHFYFQIASWWIVDVTLYCATIALGCWGVFMFWLWVKVLRDIRQAMSPKPMIRPPTAGRGVTQRYTTYAKSRLPSRLPPKSSAAYKRL